MKASCMALWVRPSPFVHDAVVHHRRPWGFPGEPLVCDHSHPAEQVLGCTSETRRQTSTPASPRRKQHRFARHSLSCGPNERTHSLVGRTTPPQVSFPSGDVPVGVRSTRAYRTRHLPPSGFLSPTTVCSSERLACPLSSRHHLWDSKNTNNGVCPAILNSSSEDELAQASQRFGRSNNTRLSETGYRLEPDGSPSPTSSAPHIAPVRHSPRALHAEPGGGGHTSMWENLGRLVPSAPRPSRQSDTHLVPCMQNPGGDVTPACTACLQNPEAPAIAAHSTAPQPERTRVAQTRKPADSLLVSTSRNASGTERECFPQRNLAAT
jgi:hypothetical protein